jgi:hypothetical protein
VEIAFLKPRNLKKEKKKTDQRDEPNEDDGS